MNRPRDERGRFISSIGRSNRSRGRGNTIANPPPKNTYWFRWSYPISTSYNS